MREFVLVLIGFFFAFYIFRHRYTAVNDISELILCLEKIDTKGMFNYDPNFEIAKKFASLDLRAPNFDVDLTSVIFNSPAIVAGDLYVRGLGIQRFLDQEYFPYDEYFRVNTKILYEFLRNCDHPDAKVKFVIDYIIGNSRVAEMADSIKYTGQWSSDESNQQHMQNNLESTLKSLGEPHLQEVAFIFVSEAKKGLISLIQSIKPKYIESRSWYSVKRACLIFGVMLSLQALFYFGWDIDLIDKAAGLLAGFFETSDY